MCKLFPSNLSLSKIIDLIHYLYVFYNFCIDEQELFCPKYESKDIPSIVIEGGFTYVILENNSEFRIPIKVKEKGYIHSNNSRELFNRGEHFKDYSCELINVGIPIKDLL